MLGLEAWRIDTVDGLAMLNRILALTAWGSTAVFFAVVLMLWWSGRKRDYSAHVPLAALISASMAVVIEYFIPVGNTVAAAFATAFLLNGKFRAATVFGGATLVLGVAEIGIGAQTVATVLGGATIGASAAAFIHLIFAATILTISLHTKATRTAIQHRSTFTDG
jgi:hypothetical protein